MSFNCIGSGTFLGFSLHTPCSNPGDSCPKAPSGPGTSHIMDIPSTNIGVHYSKDDRKDFSRDIRDNINIRLEKPTSFLV